MMLQPVQGVSRVSSFRLPLCGPPSLIRPIVRGRPQRCPPEKLHRGFPQVRGRKHQKTRFAIFSFPMMAIRSIIPPCFT